MIISFPLGYIKIFFPQLNLPTFLFLIYLIISLPHVNKKFNLSHIKKPVLLITSVYILSLIVSIIYFIPQYESGMSTLRQFPIYILFFHFVSKEIINKSITELDIIIWYLTGVIILAILYLLNINVSYEIGGRLSVMGINPNLIAVICSSSIIFIIYLIREHKIKGLTKYIFFIFIPILLFMMINTGSRGGFIGIVLAIITIFYFSKKGFFGKLSKMIQATIVIVLLTFLFFSNDVFENRFLYEETSLMDTRLPLWQSAFSTVEDNLLFGIGIFRYQYDINLMTNRIISTHNEYLSILVYSGLTGLILFLWFLYEISRSAYMRNKNHKNPYYLGFMVLILFLLFKGGGILLTFFTWLIFILIYTSKFNTQRNKHI